MTAASSVVWAVALGGAWLLLAAGTQHLRRPQRLRAALQAQRAPATWQRVATWWGLVEVLIGAAVLVSFALGPPRLMPPGALTAGLLYLGFGAHVLGVLRRAPGAPCGCFGDEPAGPAVVVRAFVFAAASLATPLVEVPDGGTRWAVLGVGVVVALMAAVLPSVLSLRHPAGPNLP